VVDSLQEVDEEPNPKAFKLNKFRNAGHQVPHNPNFFFFITLKPRVDGYTKSMSLKYEPSSEPLHISVKPTPPTPNPECRSN